MKTYCLSCTRHTNNNGAKKVTMRNKIIKQKSRCVNCMFDKSRFFKQKYNKKTGWNNINTKLLLY